MRTAVLALSALLLAAPALAHGEDARHFSVTDTGCSLSAPPCILADDGSSVEAGTTTTIEFTNRLEATQDLMVHLDADGGPGALVAGTRPAAPGETIQLTFDVPADATGVWYMAVQGGEETARLFGPAVSDDHAPTEDSPGVGALLALGVLGVAAVRLRRS